VKAPTVNRLVVPGARVRVKRHVRGRGRETWTEEGYYAVVLGRVEGTRHAGDPWYVRDERSWNVRCVLSGWCRVLRGRRA
jgi:hypothetical protein